MEHAAAMKYGGELVAAVDCNYDSFKELVPLCPECREPVFLRVGGDRTSSLGKAYQIGPHWCHFKGVSAEQVAGCESRVNSYTEKDKQRIATKARGQRLKLLQRWFWRVFCENIIMEGVVESLNTPGNKSLVKQEFEQYHAQNAISYFKDKAYDLIQRYSVDFPDVKDGSVAEKIRAMSEDKSHIALCREVVGFLSSKGSFSLLCDCMMAMLVLVRHGEKERPDLFPATHTAIGLAVETANTIVIIPWASEFQRLESESQQRKATA